MRTVWEVVVFAWGAAFLASFGMHGVLGLERGWQTGLMLVAATVFGGLVGMGAARDLEAYGEMERRDVILGWGALLGAVATVLCLLLPLPWSAVAAFAAVGVTVAALRRVSAAPSTARPAPRAGGDSPGAR